MCHISTEDRNTLSTVNSKGNLITYLGNIRTPMARVVAIKTY